MLYPLVPCPTQPLIDVANVTLRNVRQYGTVLPPGVIRCNETNPCTGFTFENVRAGGWWRLFGLNYITENVQGTVTDSRPAPAFTGPDGQVYTEDAVWANFVDFWRNEVMPWIGEHVDFDWDTNPIDSDGSGNMLEDHYNENHKFHFKPKTYGAGFRNATKAFSHVYRRLAF